MKNPTKPKIFILMGIFILLLVSGAVGFMLLSNEYKKTQLLTKKLEEITKEKQAIEQNLNETKQQIVKLNSTLRENQDKTQLLLSQVENEKKLKEDLETKLNDLNLQLDTEKKTKITLEERVTRLQGDLENFMARFKEIEEEKQEIQTKLEDYESKTQLDLGTIVVEPEEKKEEGVTITKLSGNILRINQNYKFLVIDSGQDQGIKEGDIFSVYHSGAYIGDVEVEKVHPNMSAANFLANLKVELLRESDTVVKKE